MHAIGAWFSNSDDEYADEYDDDNVRIKGQSSKADQKGSSKKPPNDVQNKQFNDAVKEVNQTLGRNLSKDEIQRLHQRVGKLGKQAGKLLEYGDIVEEGLDMFGGGE